MAQTFGHYLAVVEVRNAQPDAVEADLAGWCDRPPLDWQVARLAAYRGVTRLGALGLAAEVADWRRFAKAGNAHLRAQLVEAAWALAAPPRRGCADRPPPAGPAPGGRRAGVGRPAAPVRPVPRAGRPQERQARRGGRDRPGARRVLVGRDDRLTQISSGSPLEIGRGGEHDSYDAPGRRRCRTDPRTNYAVACAGRP